MRSKIFRLIISKIIKKPFKGTGITLNLDGCEDEMFNECNWLLGYE